MLVFHCLLVLSLETGNWELGHVPHSGDFPFRERENNHVPVVLNPSFSNIPRTTFPFLDPIDPGTWLLRSIMYKLPLMRFCDHFAKHEIPL
jgi:hypothetical protein